VQLKVLDTSDWRAVNDELGEGLRDGGSLRIHLDTLGDAGLIEPGYELDPASVEERAPVGVAWFEESAGSATEQAAIAAVRAAVDAASGDGVSILVLPELAASPNTLAALVARLGEVDDADDEGRRAPALTVIGLHHEPAGDHTLGEAGRLLVGTSPLASRVNEAIVLGSDGRELWRHRKLSSAQAPFEVSLPDGAGTAEAVLVEDVVLGDTLAVAPLPIGSVAVVICLDAFTSHVRERLVASPADVLLVPSLSQKIARHRSALNDIVQRTWGVGFVANRGFAPPPGKGTVWNEDENRSFWVVQRDVPQEFSAPDPPGRPSFVVTTPDRDAC
jgi:predicted amidohydrolase